MDGFDTGKYRTLARLGSGGMAEVFLVVARGPAGFNKLTVVKRLRNELARSAEHRAMFLDEARLAARLNHPNVVQTLEVIEHGEDYLLTMEYLEGQTLSGVTSRLKSAGVQVPHALAAYMCAEALAGLHYAHELSDYNGAPLRIVHRDVSPQNIFVTYDGQVKIVDFGIAKAEVSTNKTQAGVFKGKAAYMAPEQVFGDVDRRSDVFAMGIVLWELIAGRRLMDAGTATKTLMRLVNGELAKPSAEGIKVDEALEAVVMRSLERDPDDRFQTAKDMRAALLAYVAEHSRRGGQDGVAALLAEHFGDVRAETAAKVHEQMAALGAHSDASMPMLTFDSEPRMRSASSMVPATGPSRRWSIGGLDVSVRSSAAPRPASLAAETPAVEEKVRARRAPYVAAVVLSGVLGFWLVLGRGGGTRASDAAQAPSAAVEVAERAPAAQAPPVTPPEAVAVAAPPPPTPTPPASVVPAAPSAAPVSAPHALWRPPPAAQRAPPPRAPAAPSSGFVANTPPTSVLSPMPATLAPAPPAAAAAPTSTGRHIRTDL